jgi:hypothetical protein
MQEIAVATVRMTSRYREFSGNIAHQRPCRKEPPHACDASKRSATGVSIQRRNMAEQTKDNGYHCDCEQRLPCAVLTVWICRFCGELHERVTNCACGKCLHHFEVDAC